MSEPDGYIAYRSAKRMGLLLAILVVLGVPMLLVDFSFLIPEGEMGFRNDLRRTGLTRLIASLPWVGGFALLVSAFFLPSLFRKRVEIEITPEGIHYPPALKEVLPWDRIERLAVRQLALTNVVAVFICEPETFPIKPLARKIAEMNMPNGDYGHINLETMRSDGDFDELVRAISHYMPVEPLY